MSESSAGAPDKQQLLGRMRDGYNTLAALLRTVRPDEQARTLGDWTVAEHVAHLAGWEKLALAVLLGQQPHEAMGLSAEDWANETDGINAALYRQHSGISLEDARSQWQQVHASLVAAIEAASDEDLARPLGAGADDPVRDLIVGNTYEHYAEHAGWLRRDLGRI